MGKIQEKQDPRCRFWNCLHPSPEVLQRQPLFFLTEENMENIMNQIFEILKSSQTWPCFFSSRDRWSNVELKRTHEQGWSRVQEFRSHSQTQK